MDDTKTRIILAAIKAVRQYGLEGVRIQNASVSVVDHWIERLFEAR